MSENYHKNFEKVLKKNFINIFVLSILEKHPSHGYKIGREIEKRTLGMWKPRASTLYWILNNQREKGFIRLIEDAKNRKVYEITDKGRETLKLMKQTQRKIRKSYRRFLMTTIINGSSVNIEELEQFDEIPNIQMLPTALKPDKFTGDLNLNERLQLLESMRASIIENRDRMNEYIKDFDETILELRNKLDKENE
ncbi:MAG: PadR family transcriptional regulator [Promethearchaeota archaeon]